MLALIFKPVIANENGVGVPAPLTDQSRADFRDEREIEGPGPAVMSASGRCRAGRSVVAPENPPLS